MSTVLGQSCSCDCKCLSTIKSGNNCRIINRQWNETLYPYLGPNDNDQRKIFTWIPGGCDDQCNWKIETIFTDSGLKFKLKSVHFDEYFYAAGNDLKYDCERRNVFTRRAKCECTLLYWEILPVPNNSGYFAIKSSKYDEYLYAAACDLIYDAERRRVFTWKYTSDKQWQNNWASQWSIQCN